MLKEEILDPHIVIRRLRVTQVSESWIIENSL